jgi:toxin ParE1/3/4
VSQVRLSPRARADLDAIWNYTTQHWGQDQAEAYLLSLGETMKLLANQPGLGWKIDDIRKGYLKFPAGSHIFIFRVQPTAVEIARILHKSMDVDGHL